MTSPVVSAVRLFIASPLTEQAGSTAMTALRTVQEPPIRTQIEAALADYRVKWVPPEQWHLTWLFLGNVATDQIPACREHLQTAIREITQIMTILEAPKVWPSRHRPSTLVCPLQSSDMLNEAFTRIQQIFSPFADPVKIRRKPFKPHLTVARIKPAQKQEKPSRNSRDKQAQPYLPLEIQIPPAPWSIEEINLYQSTLTSEGPIYQALEFGRLR